MLKRKLEFFSMLLSNCVYIWNTARDKSKIQMNLGLFIEIKMWRWQGHEGAK